MRTKYLTFLFKRMAERWVGNGEKIYGKPSSPILRIDTAGTKQEECVKTVHIVYSSKRIRAIYYPYSRCFCNIFFFVFLSCIEIGVILRHFLPKNDSFLAHMLCGYFPNTTIFLNICSIMIYPSKYSLHSSISYLHITFSNINLSDY